LSRPKGVKLRKSFKLEINPIIVDWLKGIKSDSTKRTYLQAFSTYYCEFLAEKMSLWVLLETAYQSTIDTKTRPWEQKGDKPGFLTDFEVWLQNQKDRYTPKSVRTILAGVMSFYRFMGIDMKIRKETGLGSLPENTYSLEKQDILRMLEGLKNRRDRAIVLLLKDSGMGGAEIKSLKIQDFKQGLDLEKGLCIFRIRRIKTGKPYTAFCGPETVAEILAYLKERDEPADDDPLFTVEKGSGWGINNALLPIFHRLNDKLGTSNFNRYGKYRAHNLRKFFKTTLTNAGLPTPLIKYLMGHKLSEKEYAYYQDRTEDLKGIYLKQCIPALSLGLITHSPIARLIAGEKDRELKKLREKLKEREKELAQIKGSLDALKTELEGALKDYSTQ